MTLNGEALNLKGDEMDSINKSNTWLGAVLFTALLVCLNPLQASAALLDQINTTVKTIQTKVNDIQTKATVIQSDSSDAINAIRAGLGALAGDMREEILGSLSDAEGQIAEIKADRVAFAANAPQFKTDLINFLQALQDLGAAVIQYTGISVSMDFQTEKNLINVLPDQALAPLYRVIGGGGVDLGVLVTRLQNATADIQTLTDANREVTAAASGPAPAVVAPVSIVPASCAKMLADPVGIAFKASTVSEVGGAIKLVGKGLIAAGYTGVSGKPIQIHGYVGIELVNDRRKKWGQRLDGLGDLLLAVSGVFTNKVRYCTIMDGTQKTLDEVIKLENSIGAGSSPDLEALIQKVDVTVSSRASQVSVDDLRTSVLQTGAAVDAINTKLSGLQGVPGAGEIDLDVIDVSTPALPNQRRWFLLPTLNGKPVDAELSGLWGISGSTGFAEDLIPNVQVVPTGTGLLEVTIPVHPGIDPSKAYQFAVQDKLGEAQGSRLVSVGAVNVPVNHHD